MQKKLIVFMLFVSGTFTVLAQKKHTYKSAFLFNPSMGFNFQVNNIRNGTPTDQLISDNHIKLFWQPVSMSFFVTDHWGIEFDIRPGALKSRPARSRSFVGDLENKYGNQYFVTGTSAFYDDFSFMEGTEKVYLGVVYITEKNKFVLIPKLLFTGSSVTTEYASASLKEKNSNNIINLTYTTDHKTLNESFTVVPGITIAYKLSDRVYFSFELLCALYRTSFTYREIVADAVTGTSTQAEYKYRQFVATVSPGAGLIIALKKKKWRR